MIADNASRGLFLRYYLSQQARDSLPSGTGDGLGLKLVAVHAWFLTFS